MILTTITPYWKRADMLTVWLKSLHASYHPQVLHLLLCAEDPPKWAHDYEGPHLRIIRRNDIPPLSIGVYHNLGAALAETEWIMKMDVDCIAHVNFFSELLNVLETAEEREWFNAGMYYIDRFGSLTNLTAQKMPLSTATFHKVMEDCSKLPFAAGTNFICRRSDYLDQGGCDNKFRGYGWEDYQQIYMLERAQLGHCPLPGQVDDHNVTQRCRDEISRRKARELLARGKGLALLHRWHEAAPNGGEYKNAQQITHNRKVLLDYILRKRQLGIEMSLHA